MQRSSSGGGQCKCQILDRWGGRVTFTSFFPQAEPSGYSHRYRIDRFAFFHRLSEFSVQKLVVYRKPIFAWYVFVGALISRLSLLILKCRIHVRSNLTCTNHASPSNVKS